MTEKEMEEYFLTFYEDLFCEAAKFGEVEEMIVCENNNDHLIGNVYIRFKMEQDAQSALENFSNRWYNGKPIYCELSPVTDFKEACCRQHESKKCKRAGHCNFIHAKRPPEQFLKELELSQLKYLRMTGKEVQSESESEDDSYRRRHRR